MARAILFFFGFLTLAAPLPATQVDMVNIQVNTVNKDIENKKDNGKENNGYKGCPDTWLKLGGWCYKAFYEEKLLSWYEANLLCEVNGGHLAEPSTPEISDYLYEVAKLLQNLSQISRWYLGLSDMGEEGNWRGPYSGEKPEAFFWGSGMPNITYGNSLDCSMMTLQQGGYYWEDIGCVRMPNGDAVAPICQRKTLDCPEGAIFHNYYCYKVGSELLEFEAAESYCNSAGGHLASVHSEEENDFIQSLTGGFGRWLGGILVDDSTNPWTWSWSDGNPWTWSWSDGSDFSFTGTWYSSDEPSAGESRISMWSNGKWYGNLPTTPQYPVCKL